MQLLLDNSYLTARGLKVIMLFHKIVLYTLAFLFICTEPGISQIRLYDASNDSIAFPRFIFAKYYVSIGVQRTPKQNFDDFGFSRLSRNTLSVNFALDLWGSAIGVKTYNVTEKANSTSKIDYTGGQFFIQVAPVYKFIGGRETTFHCYGGIGIGATSVSGRLNNVKLQFSNKCLLADLGFGLDRMLFRNDSSMKKGTFVGLRTGYQHNFLNSKWNKEKGKSVILPKISYSGYYIGIISGHAAWGP